MILQRRIFASEVPLSLFIQFDLSRMKPFCPDIIHRVWPDSKIYVFQILVLIQSHADYLIKTCLKVYDTLKVFLVLYIIKFLRYAIQRQSQYEFRIEWISVIRQWARKKEPPVVELLELIWVNYKFARLLIEWSISHLDDLLLRDSIKEPTEKCLRYLKPVVLFGEGHASEDSLVMSAFFNLIRICVNTTNNDLNEHIRMQLADCKRLTALPVMASLLPLRKREGDNEEDILSKLLRIEE